MPAILVTIKTLQPVLATSFQGDPNSDVSYDYIPGSMIRGAIIGRYLQHKGLRELDLADPEAQRLFFKANYTRYLNAYLVSQKELHRTLPVPRSWYKPKDAEISENGIYVYDLSLEQDDEQDSLKVIRNGFCVFEDSYIRLYTPARRINIHNTRDRRKGRSSKREDQPDSEGAIFRYDALDAGQTFQSVILCEGQDVELFTQLLRQPDLWLGGSRSAGYGHTQISYEIQDSWREFPPLGEEEEIDSERLTITLLSDTLLRDDNGQPSADPSLIAAAINTTCGSSLPTPEPRYIFSSQTYIGGFNRKWGLPLPQVPALAAGTVVVFENATLTEEQKQQLYWQGIGDRRNEGFGRLAINWHQQASFQIKKPPELRSNTQEPAIRSTDLATFMAERILRQRLEQQLKKAIEPNKIKRNENGKLPISNSQLSRLMIAARQGLATGSLQPVRDFLNPENLTKTALQQFQSARLDSGDNCLYEALKQWSKSPHSWLGLPNRNLTVKLGSNIGRTIESNATNDPLVTEYTLKLIMAVAKQGAKENQR